MGGPGGSHGEWDQVAEVGQVYEAELLALPLREAGIPTRVVDQSFRQEPLPDVRAFSVVRLLVPASRSDEARRLLADLPSLPDGADATPAEGTAVDGEREEPEP